MTKVKICGLKEPAHVKAAVDAGADAIGFVFAPSSRRVTVEQAKELAQKIPSGVLKVGVFVNPTREEVARAFREVPLDLVQYHGDESADFIHAVGLPAIRAVAVRSTEDVERAMQLDTAYTLVDAPGTVYKGGSGVTFDWKLLKDCGITTDRLILAGGLNAENVGEAIRRVAPFMVDVSSGVERNKRKDESLIRAFLRAVNSTQQESPRSYKS